jgi:hypothetical protein
VTVRRGQTSQPGWLEAWRRDDDGWLAYVRYSVGVGMQRLAWLAAERVSPGRCALSRCPLGTRSSRDAFCIIVGVVAGELASSWALNGRRLTSAAVKSAAVRRLLITHMTDLTPARGLGVRAH